MRNLTIAPIKNDQKPYHCEFCKSGFMRESTLLTHQCEQKRRHMLKDDISSRMAFMAYLRWYEVIQRDKNRSFRDFCSSEFYIGFMKFGHFLMKIKPINSKQFVDFIITKNIRLDKWCDDNMYYDFVSDFVKRESPEDALERSIATMMSWAKDNKTEWQMYFQSATLIRISRDLREGRLSPWLILNTKTGMTAMRRLPDSELSTLNAVISPSFWLRRFSTYNDEVQFIKSVAEENNL